MTKQNKNNFWVTGIQEGKTCPIRGGNFESSKRGREPHKNRRFLAEPETKFPCRTLGPSRKGQVFLIIGIFVLLALILLKTETSQTGKNAFYAGLNWKILSENIVNEYQKAADISLSQENTGGNLEKNMNNFTNFSVDSLNQKGYVLSVFYSFAFVNATNITVAVGNFQGSNITNISVNTSIGWSSFASSLANRQSNSSAFPPAEKFNVTVSYFLNGTANSLSYSSDSNVTSSFYVALRLQQADSFTDDKITFNKTSI